MIFFDNATQTIRRARLRQTTVRRSVITTTTMATAARRGGAGYGMRVQRRRGEAAWIRRRRRGRRGSVVEVGRGGLPDLVVGIIVVRERVGREQRRGGRGTVWRRHRVRERIPVSVAAAGHVDGA